MMIRVLHSADIFRLNSISLMNQASTQCVGCARKRAFEYVVPFFLGAFRLYLAVARTHTHSL